MIKDNAIIYAIELAKVALSSSEVAASKESADDVADFIETLTDRILKLSQSN